MLPKHRLHDIQIRVDFTLQQILVPLTDYLFINLLRALRSVLPIQGKCTQQALFGGHHDLVSLDVSLYPVCIKSLHFFLSALAYQFEEQEFALDFFYV